MAYKHYVPTKCSMRECAFPLATCANCRCCASVFGKYAAIYNYPADIYKAGRMYQKNNANHHG